MRHHSSRFLLFVVAALITFSATTATNKLYAGDSPTVEDLFTYLETMDFAQLGDPFPDGISSLDTSTGDDFAQQRVETQEATVLAVNGQAVAVDTFLDSAAALTGNSAQLDDFVNTLQTNAVFANRILIALGASEFTTPAIEALFTSNDTARTDTVANVDPYLARQIEITNPFDVTTTFRFEAAIETVGLDPITATAEGRFSAEVFDTGGEIGAELEFNLGHTLRQADSLDELSVQVGHSGTINDGELSTHEVGPITNFAVALEDFDRILSSAFLTLSPGDTAVVTSIGNFGDATFPLVPLDEIEADLAITVEIGDLFQTIPEPSSLVLLGLAGLGMPSRRALAMRLPRVN